MILGDACISGRLALSLTMPNENAENAAPESVEIRKKLPPLTQ
jgi:hypothetical protein